MVHNDDSWPQQRSQPKTDHMVQRKHFPDENEFRYMSLIQDHIQPFFPKFTASISGPSVSKREQGRCAMVEFKPRGTEITSFPSSEDLHRTLTDLSPPPYHEASHSPCRRLFVLEDLPRNYILVLGSRLNIPPSFFAGHWDDPASSAFNHRNPLQRSTLPSFRLRYATSNRIEVVEPEQTQESHTNLYAFDTNVCRYLHTYSRNGPLYDEPRSHHTMSFWSSNVREDGGWDAVLLVDPPPQGHIRCVTTGEKMNIRNVPKEDPSMAYHFLHPEFDSKPELPHDPAKWATQYTKPQYKSMFDDIIQSYHLFEQKSSKLKDPFVVVEVPRKLVISTLVSYLRRRYLNLLDMQKTQQQQHTLRSHHLSYTTLPIWSTEFYQYIAGTCACMKEFTREMDENTTALGLDRSRCPAPSWEVDGWKSIRESTRAVKGIANSLAANYSQYVTIQEAHASNMTAQNLSKITVLTMLFVPLSTVASIFSMGDEFLPGKTHAWVFWIVAIPVLLVLANIYWFKRLLICCKRGKDHLLPVFEFRRNKTSMVYP